MAASAKAKVTVTIDPVIDTAALAASIRDQIATALERVADDIRRGD